MRTMHIQIGIRNYSVTESGEITRLPYEFITPNGGVATKKAKVLKPTKTKNGYMRLCLSDGHYMAHRIVFEAFNGAIPAGMDIDHINGIREDNRLENLRLATRRQNALNRQKANANNSAGARGVYFHHSSGCWVFAVSGKQLMSSKDKQKVIDFALDYHDGSK
jgi:hypothetical protein